MAWPWFLVIVILLVTYYLVYAVSFRGEDIPVRAISEEAFHGADISLFALEAALALSATGLVNRNEALAMVRRYALKPGYQLSYTIGRQKFRQIYAAYLNSGRKPARFVKDALSHGEIGFDHLADRLLR